MKKDAITDAALRLFANQGYEGTSMQQIADAIGIQKPTLYSHFKSKLEIYTAIVNTQTVLYKEKVFAHMEDYKNEPPRTILKYLFINTIEYSLKKEIILFWKQAFLQAAANENSESYKITKRMMREIGLCAENVLTGILNEGSKYKNDKVQSIMIRFMVIIQGFLDWMLAYMDSGDDILKRASEIWDVLSKHLFD